MTLSPVCYLPLSVCTHWETSLWFASAAAAAAGWHGASAVTCPRPHPHVSRFYMEAKQHQRNPVSVQIHHSITGRVIRMNLFADLCQPPLDNHLSLNILHTHTHTPVSLLVYRLLPVNALSTPPERSTVTGQNFHTEPSDDSPDLNLLRISTEWSEPRRVIMITVQVQRIGDAK